MNFEFWALPALCFVTTILGGFLAYRLSKKGAEVSSLRAQLALAAVNEAGLRLSLDEKNVLIERERQEMSRLNERVVTLASLNSALDETCRNEREKCEALVVRATALVANQTVSEADLEEARLAKATLEERCANLEKAVEEERAATKTRTEELETGLADARNRTQQLELELTGLKEQEPIRRSQHDLAVQSINEALRAQKEDREREAAEALRAEEQKRLMQRETWKNHEKDVETKLAVLCQQFSIEHFSKDSFPLKGKPDNAVKICDEFVIFDSKAPGLDEDLSNFPDYIKRQAETAEKYTKQEGVRKQVFFVVPRNAIQAITDTMIQFPTYGINVLTVDSLPVVLMCLKRIESYEFATTLSPEERENVVAMIGRMLHGLKRRVQVDQFMSKHFLALMTEADNLPSDIVSEARKVEIASKVNAPQEKRGKRGIDPKELTRDFEQISARLAAEDHQGVAPETLAEVLAAETERTSGIPVLQ